jgi:outer membrane protein TolC
MRGLIILLFLLAKNSFAFAQITDTSLNAEQYLLMVKKYHPVVKLAQLNVDVLSAEVQMARGIFNPIISNYLTNKTFSNENYFNYLNPNITIPTWYGLDVNVGLESLAGNRFDPSETVGQSSYAGITMPLVKNLVMDKRRAAVLKAKLYKQLAEVEQQAAINNILQEAIGNYWEWVDAYQGFKIIEKNFETSKLRLVFVKKSFLNGERPAMDTVEALTQLQTFEFQKNESWLKFLNKGLELSAFLWTENNLPYLLPQNIIPNAGWENETNIALQNIDLQSLLIVAQNNHPELLVYTPKLKALEVDKKLQFQELLPKLDFKYNQLSKGYNIFNTSGLVFQNNFNYGLKLEMPLQFTTGRGLYKRAKLVIKETQLLQSQKQLSIELKVKKYYNEYQYLKTQTKIIKGQKNFICQW